MVKDIETITDEIIGDIKKIFRFQAPNKLTKVRTIFIPENRINVLEYILRKNIEGYSP